ncbi:MAG: DUF3306 domain-containing protein [Pseudomonadota bacterium]
MNSREDGFLSRWAKRKADVRETEARETEERQAALAPQVDENGNPAAISEGQPPAVDEAARDEPPDEETRQRWIEELEAVDIETLTYDNDFTVFMKSWVPGPLRQRALRKLWTTNPALAVLDGLNDYDLDYTDAAMQAGKVVSSYVPGRGYATLEEVAEKLAGAIGDEDDEQGAGEDDLPEFEGEESAALDDRDQPDDVQTDAVGDEQDELPQQQVDETAIAVPQNDVKLKS